MRQGLDWYKRDPRAFIDGIQGLGPELIGAYAVILDLIYARGGATTADPRHLAGVLGCSLRKARALVEALIEAEKIAEIDGEWTNKRASIECENQLKTRRKLAESGAKGGRKVVENRSEANENKDLAQATLKHIRVDKSKNPPKPPEGFDAFWSVYPRKENKGGARKKFEAAIKRGIQPDKLIAAAERYAKSETVQRGFVKHPTTWLNNECWDDEATTPQSGAPRSQQSFFTEADREARDRLLGKKNELRAVA